MSWMQKLYRTYNEVEQSQTLPHAEKEMLAPVWHSPQTAHIHIILDGDGNFISAKVLGNKPIVMLPVTESSEGRTSGLAPHALADSLQYIAKDLGLTYSEEVTIDKVDGGKTKKVKQKIESLIFKLYANQLDKWCEITKNPKVLAIHKYIHKGTVLADLIKSKVIPTTENGELLTNWSEKEYPNQPKPELFNVLTKEQGKFEIRKALVIWSVNIPRDLVPETWKDKEVQNDWAEYYQSTLDTQFCLVTGELQKMRESHPAKLTYSGDKAKLISANDKEGYTYRGRFENANQASSISAEVSHKSHAALRWLISRQGIRNGEQVTVAWAISGEKIPSPLQDPFNEFYDNEDEEKSAVENDVESEAHSETEGKIDHSVDLGKSAAEIIKKKYQGYKAKLKAHEQISLLMLDSATPGRMALTYYQEFLPADYFANLDAWIDDFSWYQRHSIETKNGKKNDKRLIWAVVPPSPFAIGNAVYGKSLSDSLKKQLYARLLPVIAGGKHVPIPYDLVQQSFRVACNPHGCENWEWQRNIGVACALYKGWRARHYDESERREYPMSLDKENRSRDYLYGRLLAVAENIEAYALYLGGEKRSTNAERYMPQFANRPFYTWRNIEIALRPYQERLRNHNKDTGSQALAEITNLFVTEDYTNDTPLSAEFLLGYHCQKMEIARQVAELSAKKSKTTETE